jgi:hypothetical protein
MRRPGLVGLLPRLLLRSPRAGIGLLVGAMVALAIGVLVSLLVRPFLGSPRPRSASPGRRRPPRPPEPEPAPRPYAPSEVLDARFEEVL